MYCFRFSIYLFFPFMYKIGQQSNNKSLCFSNEKRQFIKWQTTNNKQKKAQTMKQTKLRERERNIIYFSRIECEMKRITSHKPQLNIKYLFIFRCSISQLFVLQLAAKRRRHSFPSLLYK